MVSFVLYRAVRVMFGARSLVKRTENSTSYVLFSGAINNEATEQQIENLLNEGYIEEDLGQKLFFFIAWSFMVLCFLYLLGQSIRYILNR